MSACRSAIATACIRVSACSLRMARLVSDLTVSTLSPIAGATCGVKPVAEQLQDLALALGERRIRRDQGHQQDRRERRIDERLAGGPCERRAGGHPAGSPSGRSRGAGGDGVGEQTTVAVGREDDDVDVRRRMREAPDRRDPVDSGRRTSTMTTWDRAAGQRPPFPRPTMLAISSRSSAWPNIKPRPLRTNG